MTWIVATIIIIFILALAIFFAKLKISNDKEINTFTGKDALASKSLFSWLLTKNTDGTSVYSQLQEENLNGFNGDLAVKIFDGYYGKEYKKVWIGIEANRTVNPFISNDYFGDKPSSRSGGDIGTGASRFAFSAEESIWLNNNKTTHFILVEG